jgi:hypothetical protein
MAMSQSLSTMTGCHKGSVDEAVLQLNHSRSCLEHHNPIVGSCKLKHKGTRLGIGVDIVDIS